MVVVELMLMLICLVGKDMGGVGVGGGGGDRRSSSSWWSHR
jgi:hypothetical protein